MVSLVEIQTAYYMVAATGVLIAAVFYILNMRETMNNRRATFSNSLMQFYFSEEGQHRFMEVMNMQWSDFEDFKRKYDSSVNLQRYAKRSALWTQLDLLGRQCRSGTIDITQISTPLAFGIVLCWMKFKPIIEAYRGWQYPKDAFSDFEYIANALMKRLCDSDPDFTKKMNVFFTTPPIDQ